MRPTLVLVPAGTHRCISVPMLTSLVTPSLDAALGSLPPGAADALATQTTMKHVVVIICTIRNVNGESSKHKQSVHS